MWLRQSTASQEIILSKFVDNIDFDTAEIALTIANTDIKLYKGGATTSVNKNSGGATHATDGDYSAILNDTDTDTLGNLKITVHVAGALYVEENFIIVPAVVYDSMILGTDNLDVSAVQLAGITSLANWIRAALRKDTADSTALTEINTGGGVYDEEVDSQESIADTISATAPLAFNPDASSVIVTGTLISGTFTDTATNNASYWVVDDAGAGIEVITEMNLGTGRSGTSFLVNAKFSSGALRIVEFWAFNYTIAAYEKFSSGTAVTEMRNSVFDQDYQFFLSKSFTNPVSVIGEIKIKFLSAQSNAGDRLSIDLVEVSGEASGVTSPSAIADAVSNSNWGISLNHIPKFTGQVYYVSGTTGNDGNSGIFPDQAFATIGAAKAASIAGDYIKLFAAIYTEAVDLNLDFLELHGEIGAEITGAGGVPLTVSANSCIIDNVILSPTAGQKGLVITGNNNRTTLTDISGGIVGVESSGTGNTFTNTHATDYTQTAFDIQNAGAILHVCTAKTVNIGTRGFYLSNTLADRSILGTCESVNNTTAGFEVVVGVTNASFFGCAESETCGTRVDNGTSTSWRQHSTTDEFLETATAQTTAQNDLDIIAGQIGYVDKRVYIDTENPVNGDGTAGSPFNNSSDAKDFAELVGYKVLVVLAEITLDRNLKNFTLIGIGDPIVNCNGQDLDKSEFTGLTLRGTYSGSIGADHCVLDDGFSLNGRFNHCALNGDLVCLPAAEVLFVDCSSIIAGLGRPTVSMGLSGSAKLSMRDIHGGMTVKDSNTPDDACTAEVMGGSLTFDLSNVDGVMVARGVGVFRNEANGATVTDECQIHRVWQRLDLDIDNPNVYTEDEESGRLITIINNDTTLTSTKIDNDTTVLRS